MSRTALVATLFSALFLLSWGCSEKLVGTAVLGTSDTGPAAEHGDVDTASEDSGSGDSDTVHETGALTDGRETAADTGDTSDTSDTGDSGDSNT